MSLSRMFLLWIVLVIILGILGIHMGIFGTGISKTEKLIQTKVEKNLIDHDWAKVRVKGQAVYLSGNAPDHQALEKSVKLALGSIGEGGVLKGAVTKVFSDNVQLVKRGLDSEFDQKTSDKQEQTKEIDYIPVFDIKLSKNGLVIEGDISDHYSEQLIRESIKEYFPEKETFYQFKSVKNVIDPLWYQAVRNAINGLSHFTKGHINVQGKTLMVEGDVEDQDKKDLAMEKLKYIQKPYNLVVHIIVDKDQYNNQLEEQNEELDICQQKLDELKGNEKIHFLFNSTEISKHNYDLLEKISDGIQSCQNMRVRVEGHTDNIGSDVVNDALSLARAQSVVEVLVGFGVNREQLLAIGYGSKKPIADNSKREGRTINRRIEFVIEK